MLIALGSDLDLNKYREEMPKLRALELVADRCHRTVSAALQAETLASEHYPPFAGVPPVEQLLGEMKAHMTRFLSNSPETVHVFNQRLEAARCDFEKHLTSP